MRMADAQNKDRFQSTAPDIFFGLPYHSVCF